MAWKRLQSSIPLQILVIADESRHAPIVLDTLNSGLETDQRKHLNNKLPLETRFLPLELPMHVLVKDGVGQRVVSSMMSQWMTMKHLKQAIEDVFSARIIEIES
jgi:hypothetical protein